MDSVNEINGDLILLRGVSGSGKSTLANIILQQPNNNPQEVLSADDFFVDDNGDYILMKNDLPWTLIPFIEGTWLNPNQSSLYSLGKLQANLHLINPPNILENKS